MTQQVRRGYRSHRRATWALVALVTVVVAAAVVPFATGAPPKEYSLKVVPSEVCFTGSGQVQPFELTLTNERGNTTLGSAEITAPVLIKPLEPLVGATTGSWVDGQVIKLRNLGLAPGAKRTVTVNAEVLSTGLGSWTSVAKQSNNFADAPGPGNLFSISLDKSQLALEVIECAASEYVFVQGPVNAEKGVPQTVKVQLKSGGQPVPVSEDLTLNAFQNGTTQADSFFDGLTASPDDSGAFAGEQWTFSITGNRSGTGYTLQAGDTSSESFAIVDGLCVKNTVDPEHLTSSCSLTSDLNGGVFESGVTINNHKLDPISINFADGSTARCGEDWDRASYVMNGQTYYLPGVELDFDWGAGMLQVIYRVRNSEWVLTDVARGNNDIEICAGARHWEGVERYGDGSLNVDGVYDPFTTKSGEDADWDGELFWGVLGTVSNPSKVKDDPVVCSTGNRSLPTGPNGASETWRTWTICIPKDWDWKNFG
jgi:hypothetical protein